MFLVECLTMIFKILIVVDCEKLLRKKIILMKWWGCTLM